MSYFPNHCTVVLKSDKSKSYAILKAPITSQDLNCSRDWNWNVATYILLLLELVIPVPQWNHCFQVGTKIKILFLEMHLFSPVRQGNSWFWLYFLFLWITVFYFVGMHLTSFNSWTLSTNVLCILYTTVLFYVAVKMAISVCLQTIALVFALTLLEELSTTSFELRY